jgi:flavin-dependent dehydrogenase
MVIRKKFDFKLAKLAVEQGAILTDSKAVVDIKILKDNVKIFLDDGDFIKSKILIGADGVWSLTAKKTGLREKSIDYGICIFEEFKVNEKIMDKFFGKSRLCHIYNRPQNINGYGWVFPKKEHLNIGIIDFIFREKNQTSQNLLKIFNGYIKILKKNNVIPKSLFVKDYKGGALPIIPLNKTYCDRVLLIGDAAGFASASTGEGIYYAMKSGKIAAEVIDEALKSSSVSEDFLSKYQRRWKKNFGKEIELFYKNRREQNLLNDKFLEIVNSDKQLTDLILEIGLGTRSLYECRWKLYVIYLFASLKYKIKNLQK